MLGLGLDVRRDRGASKYCWDIGYLHVGSFSSIWVGVSWSHLF
jgi:hypothetical protein